MLFVELLFSSSTQLLPGSSYNNDMTVRVVLIVLLGTPLTSTTNLWVAVLAIKCSEILIISSSIIGKAFGTPPTLVNALTNCHSTNVKSKHNSKLYMLVL